MKLPAIEGIIDRRILVNFQIDPDALTTFLPPPFQPKLVRGVGIGGICLIRLTQIRPRGMPAVFGISSENAAHRIAVTWETNAGVQEGVYVPRRDSSSTLNALVGGRLFPGVHHLATFEVAETETHFAVQLHSHDEVTTVAVQGRPTAQLPETSVFTSVEEASAFFESGSVGYSPVEHQSCCYEGLELRTLRWNVEPMAVEHVASSFFQRQGMFPPSAVAFDCALLMRDIPHRWLSRPMFAFESPEAQTVA